MLLRKSSATTGFCVWSVPRCAHDSCPQQAIRNGNRLEGRIAVHEVDSLQGGPETFPVLLQAVKLALDKDALRVQPVFPNSWRDIRPTKLFAKARDHRASRRLSPSRSRAMHPRRASIWKTGNAMRMPISPRKPTSPTGHTHVVKLLPGATLMLSRYSALPVNRRRSAQKPPSTPPWLRLTPCSLSAADTGASRTTRPRRQLPGRRLAVQRWLRPRKQYRQHRLRPWTASCGLRARSTVTGEWISCLDASSASRLPQRH